MYRKHEENVRNMSGKSEEKAKKKGLKNVYYIDYSNNPKKNFPGGLTPPPDPPPEIAHQGREINLKIRGGEKKSNLCHNIAPCLIVYLIFYSYYSLVGVC